MKRNIPRYAINDRPLMIHPDYIGTLLKTTVAAGGLPEKRAEEDETTLVGSVAIIPVCGTLVNRSSFFSFFGDSNYQKIREQFQACLNDSNVTGIVLDIDSPGGEEGGCFELVDEIYEARGTKPIIAMVSADALSAAYALASAADTVYVTRSGNIGSIGVFAVHVDVSRMDEKNGLKFTAVFAGEYKMDGWLHAPLSEDARVRMQNLVDTTYEIFAAIVARNRKINVKDVKATEALSYKGEAAVEIGFADKVGTLDDAVQAALGGAPLKIQGKQQIQNTKGKESKMEKFSTVAELVAAYPEFAQALRDEGKASVDVSAAKTEAAKEERTRTLHLVKIHFEKEPGEVFEKIVGSGITAEQLTAIAPGAGAKAMGQAQMKEMLQAIMTAGAPSPGAGGNPGPSSKDFMALVEEHRAAHKCSKGDAMRAVVRSNPEAHKQYLASLHPQGSA